MLAPDAVAEGFGKPEATSNNPCIAHPTNSLLFVRTLQIDPMRTWSLQKARNHLRDVIDSALDQVLSE